MSTNDTYLAVFLGSKISPKMMAWNSLPEAERQAKPIQPERDANSLFNPTKQKGKQS
jgi:hypothetical protein